MGTWLLNRFPKFTDSSGQGRTMAGAATKCAMRRQEGWAVAARAPREASSTPHMHVAAVPSQLADVYPCLEVRAVTSWAQPRRNGARTVLMPAAWNRCWGICECGANVGRARRSDPSRSLLNESASAGLAYRHAVIALSVRTVHGTDV